MSQENVEAVRQGFEAFNRRDVDALVAVSHPECEWVPFRAQLEGETYHGHDGVRRFVADMDGDWERFEIHPQELEDLGERVLVIGRVEALGLGSGVAVENLGGFIFDMADGRIYRLVSYSDPDQARAEARE